MAGLPWFKQQVDLRRDPRALILGDMLGDTRAWTYVVEMRMYLAENAPTGCVSGAHADIALERGSGWTGERGRLLAALRDAGFIAVTPARDGIGRQIEDLDWEREQGAHVRKFQADAQKPDGRAHKVVNPSREVVGSSAAPARLPSGESRELRVESREEATTFPTASRSAPGQDGLPLDDETPTPKKPRKPKAEPAKPPVDSRHAPLRLALVAAGWPFDGGRDAGNLTAILGLCDQQEPTKGAAAHAEVLRRAKIAKDTADPFYATLSGLRTFWGRLNRAPTGRGPAPPGDFSGPIQELPEELRSKDDSPFLP